MTDKKDEQEKTLAQLTKSNHENEQLRRELQNAGQRLRELSDLTSSSTELSTQLREARHAEEAERILNQKLNRELHQQKDQVAQLRRVFFTSTLSHVTFNSIFISHVTF